MDGLKFIFHNTSVIKDSLEEHKSFRGGHTYSGKAMNSFPVFLKPL